MAAKKHSHSFGRAKDADKPQIEEAAANDPTKAGKIEFFMKWVLSNRKRRYTPCADWISTGARSIPM
jgi:hypothetical protein